MTKNSLYNLVLLLSISGIAWTGYLLYLDINEKPLEEYAGTACLVKTLTGIPCPSCGTSRSVVALTRARFTEAFMWNPIGFILLPAMLVFPVWILLDRMRGRSNFFDFYHNIEKFFRKKWVMYISISMVLGLWIWNLLKM